MAGGAPPLARGSPMRVAIVTPVFPSDLDQPSRGAGIGAVTLARALLAEAPDLDLHIVHYRAEATLPERRLGSPAMTVHTHAASKAARAAPTPALMQAEVARVLRRIQPDVVHVRGTASLVDGRAWPAVLSVHGITEREVALSGMKGARLRSQLHRLREPPARARYRHVIAIVGHVTQALDGQLTGRVHFVPNTVGDEFFAAAGDRTGTAPLIVHAGDVCPIKNAAGTVRAMAVLRRRGVDCRLRILGQVTYPDYGRQVQALVEELGLQDRVELPGRIGRGEMPGELSRARVLALPSFVEVAPLSIIEASAAGVPSVASPAGGNAELVFDRYAGRLCSPSSPESIADALQPYLEDEALATLHGRRAREIAERHRPAAVARGTLAVYEAVRAGG